MPKYKKADVNEARERLAMLLKPVQLTAAKRPEGDAEFQTVYMLVRTVSRSGMSRTISAWIVDEHGELERLDWCIAQVTGWALSKNGGVKIDGCGMDMGFHMLDYVTHTVFGRDAFRGANDFRISYL